MPTDRQILIVDDDEFFRKALARALTAQRFTVQAAANGRKALEHLADSPSQKQSFLLNGVHHAPPSF